MSGTNSCLSSDAFSHFQQREAELRKLNEELDSRKNKAVQEVTSACQDAERSSLFSKTLDTSKVSSSFEGVGDALSRPPRPRSAVTPSREKEVTHATGPGGLMVPSTDLDHLHETIVAQKARFTALQDEHNKLIEDKAQVDAELKASRAEAKSSCEENIKLMKNNGNLDAELNKERGKVAERDHKIKEMRIDEAELLKEKHRLEVSERTLEKEIQGKDARINRLLEDNERYKSLVEKTKSIEQGRSQDDRKEVERLQTEVRKLERQRGELIAAFKKQMKLIDVLKRQKVHIEAARMLSFTEEEFIRILDLEDKVR